jgi:hypothetical protein
MKELVAVSLLSFVAASAVSESAFASHSLLLTNQSGKSVSCTVVYYDSGSSAWVTEKWTQNIPSGVSANFEEPFDVSYYHCESTDNTMYWPTTQSGRFCAPKGGQGALYHSDDPSTCSSLGRNMFWFGYTGGAAQINLSGNVPIGG